MQGHSQGGDREGTGARQVVSAGGVVFRSGNDGFEVALIQNRGIWGLPKGNVEKGETLETAALREAREETGLVGELMGKIGEISYSFVRNRRYLKTVHFYLVRCVGGSVNLHDSEVDEVRWFSVLDALRVMKYPGERGILKKASSMLH